jgi:AhpD family alkylhydroperoxidase
MNKKLWMFAALMLAVASVPAWAEPTAGTPAPTPANAQARATRAEIEKMVGFVPDFLKAVPDVALPGAWEELKTLQINQSTAVPCKLKELIGLAVASQIPCKYCIYAHTELAKLSGANQEEIGEAVTMSALARHWSTFMNGIQLDESKFKQEINDVVARLRSANPNASAPKPIQVVDAKTARADAQQSFGAVPEFLKRFPDVAAAGAYREWRDVELSPNTALSGKDKSLMSLAVASQIPCKYCVYADTEFAKLEGATQAEIDEAVAMASLVRHWSTLLNGLQIDEAGYRRDADRLVRGVKAQQKQDSRAQVSTTKR